MGRREVKLHDLLAPAVFVGVRVVEELSALFHQPALLGHLAADELADVLDGRRLVRPGGVDLAFDRLHASCRKGSSRRRGEQPEVRSTRVLMRHVGSCAMGYSPRSADWLHETVLGIGCSALGIDTEIES